MERIVVGLPLHNSGREGQSALAGTQRSASGCPPSPDGRSFISTSGIARSKRSIDSRARDSRARSGRPFATSWPLRSYSKRTSTPAAPKWKQLPHRWRIRARPTRDHTHHRLRLPGPGRGLAPPGARRASVGHSPFAGSCRRDCRTGYRARDRRRAQARVASHAAGGRPSFLLRRLRPCGRCIDEGRVRRWLEERPGKPAVHFDPARLCKLDGCLWPNRPRVGRRGVSGLPSARVRQGLPRGGAMPAFLGSRWSANSCCPAIRWPLWARPGRGRRSILEKGEPIPGDPTKFLNLIHIDDAARAGAAALGRGGAGAPCTW